MFSNFFRRRPRGPDAFGRRVTLFDQSALPAALRLPRPGDPFARVMAGSFDALVAGAGGACCFAAAGAAGANPVDASAVAQAAALALWAVRDALGDGGSRSLGKRLFSLEIALSDGTLAPRSAALARSWYYALLPAATLHPFVGLSLEVLLFADLATLVLTPDARKAGDYMVGTRVVAERIGRAARLAEASELQEARALREQVEKQAPGLLAEIERESGGKAAPWWHSQQSILAGAAATTARIQTPLQTQVQQQQQQQQQSRLPSAYHELLLDNRPPKKR